MKIRSKGLTVILLILSLAGCSGTISNKTTPKVPDAQSHVEQSSTQAITPPAQTRQITPPTEQTTPAAGIDTEEELVIQNNEIFHFGKKLGYIKDGRIYISFHNNTVSFEGDPAKLEFVDTPTSDVNQGFAYNGLELSTEFSGPFDYEEIKYDKISYKCDGSLVETGNPRADVPNYYCTTNGKDFLTQFEFSGAGGYVVFTGAEAGQNWYKLYLKRIYGINYIFAGGICDHENNEEFLYRADSYNKMLNQDKVSICAAIYGGGYDGDKAYKKIANITYLNHLLKSDYAKNYIASWDKMAESFRVEQK